MQQPCGEPPRILDQAFGREQQRGAALVHGARPAMPAAAVKIIRIALPKPEARERKAKRVGRDLGVGGLVALAVGMRADLQIDQAVLSEAHFRHFIGLAARRFEKAGIAEATQLAPVA